MPDDAMKTRREAAKLILGGLAAVPLMELVASAAAAADELPHLSETDPQAQALMYHDDATKAPRTAKGDVPADKQFCHTCMFLQPGEGQWRPCQLFPANTVNIDGWCSVWTAKTS